MAEFGGRGWAKVAAFHPDLGISGPTTTLLC